MKMFRKKMGKVFALALMVSGFSVLSADELIGRIAFVQVDSNGTAGIYFTSMTSGCKNPGYHTFSVNNNAGQSLYETAIAAYLSGRQISLFRSGCTSGWGVSTLKLRP